jgi:hypothetical protein
MSILSFGNFVVDVDVEETKKFYTKNNNYICECQVCRNYEKFCEKLTDEEKGFFSSLGIVPECHSEFYGTESDNKNMLFVVGMYYVKGTFINKPELVTITADKLIELNFETLFPDYSFKIGRYEVIFEINDIDIESIPVGFPEPILKLKFSITVPWLLDEKYESYTPAKWWQLLKKLKQNKERKNIHKEYLEKIHNKIVKYFEKQGIKYSELTLAEVKKYKIMWFNKFVPILMKREARAVCFPNRKYNNYLWHLFSYEYITCIEDEAAIQQYLNKEREKCYILLDYENLCFEINRSDLLDINFINSVKDIYITDLDFTWTYVHTHELQCGPYYYKK